MKTPEQNLHLEKIDLQPEIYPGNSALVEYLTPVEKVQEFVQSIPENIKEHAFREDAIHRKFWSELSENNESVLQIKGIVGDLLEKSGLPRNFLDVAIFDSNSLDVHIQLISKKIRISRKFIEVVEGDSHRITSVLAHEIGHILLGHYLNINKKDEYTLADPLSERIQGYENEYQADRASVLLTNRSGILPTTLADTLSLVEEDIRSRNTEEGELYEGFSPKIWIASSHPHTPRRIMSIRRDARQFPRYKTTQSEKIHTPTTDEFEKKKDIKFWGEAMLGESDSLYIDCLWDELPKEVVEKLELNLETFKKDHKIQNLAGGYDAVLEDYWREEATVSEPLEYLPDEVNAWSKDNKNELYKWWQQSIALFPMIEGYEDVMNDISEYSPESIRLVLGSSCPEYCALNEQARDIYSKRDYDSVKIDPYGDESKYMAQQTLLYDTKYEYLGSRVLSQLTSVLIKSLFEKDSSLKTPSGFVVFCGFLRNFYKEHGQYLAYSGGRYFIHLENLFNNAEDKKTKDEIVNICKEYREELLSGVSLGMPLAKELMPNICAYADLKFSEPVFNPNPQIKENIKSLDNDFEQKAKKAYENEQLTPEEARDILSQIPKNYRISNLTQLTFDATTSYYKNKAKHGTSDIILEAGADSSARSLGTEEFEEKYFGKGRNEYEKAFYRELDNSTPLYSHVEMLWKRAGSEELFEQMDNGQEKLDFLLSTYPVQSAKRDILVAKSIGLGEIKHVEEILDIQEKIKNLEDVELLFKLHDAFANPLLNLSVAQKLWEIHQNNDSEFKSHVPLEEKERIVAELKDLPDIVKTPELEAILLCHKHPTYLRDELLRPLVDAAPDQETTLAVASWYCEPPPGVLKPRAGEIVAVTETVLDVVRDMPLLDKQELFMYFLGHRSFYSGIDSQFFFNLKKHEKKIRSDSIFLSKKKFYEKYKIVVDEATQDITSDSKRLKTQYVVSSPDSLVFVTKASGIPLEIMLKQHTLTTTRREQRDFIEHTLFGNEGILKTENKEKFVTSVARTVVDNSSWSGEQSLEGKRAMTDLLAFALNNCPEHRLPDLFLGLWNLQQEKQALPNVVANLLRELGSVFVKGGQYLGTQSGSLPLDWVRAFRGLSDKNMRSEKTLVYEHEYALYGDKSPFKRIGEKQGEGSMAAVYKGELAFQQTDADKGEQDIAIKVFHPSIKEELVEDVAFLNSLVGFINQHKKEFNIRLPNNLGEVTNNQILKELDFESITKNNADIDTALTNSESLLTWDVPAVLSEVSKPEMVVYKFAHGVPLDQLPEGIQSTIEGEVAIELIRQIMVEGIYQADPNIGNFKVEVPSDTNKEMKIHWLDTDHVGRLNVEEREQLKKLIADLVFDKTPQNIARTLSNFVNGQSDNNKELIPEIENWLVQDSILADSSVENVEKLFTSFLDFLAERKLVLKEQFVTLLRALGLMKPLLLKTKPENLLSFFQQILTE